MHPQLPAETILITYPLTEFSLVLAPSATAASLPPFLLPGIASQINYPHQVLVSGSALSGDHAKTARDLKTGHPQHSKVSGPCSLQDSYTAQLRLHAAE